MSAPRRNSACRKALEYYTFTTNDLTPVILKLKSANPDVFHHIARDQDAILSGARRASRTST